MSVVTVAVIIVAAALAGLTHLLCGKAGVDGSLTVGLFLFVFGFILASGASVLAL